MMMNFTLLFTIMKIHFDGKKRFFLVKINYCKNVCQKIIFIMKKWEKNVLYKINYSIN